MLRTNFPNSQLEIYEEAIKKFKEQTGDKRLFISNKAYDIYDNLLKNHSSLYDTKSEDLTIFWRIFDKINKHS